MYGLFGVCCKGEDRSRSGGLALFWRDDIDLEVIGSTLNYIDCMMECNGDKKWRFTGMYGYPEEEKKIKRLSY